MEIINYQSINKSGRKAGCLEGSRWVKQSVSLSVGQFISQSVI